MQVILLRDVPSIGRKYEVKEVKDGYARNRLIPQGLVVAATPEKRKWVESKAAETAAEKQIQEDLLAKNFDAVQKASLILEVPANEKGHLFQGIHEGDIAEALLTQTHIALPAEAVKLEQPLKEVGEHQVPIVIGEKKATLTVTVNAASR